MAIILPPRKKIEDAVPQLRMAAPRDWSNTSITMGTPRGSNASAPLRVSGAAPSIPQSNDNFFQWAGKKIVSGLQQGAAGVADVAIQGGGMLDELTNQLQGGSEIEKNQRRLENIARSEQLRGKVHNLQDIEGNELVGTRDVDQQASDIAAGRGDIRDYAALAGKGLQVGLDATSLVNPASLAGRSTFTTALKTAGRDAALYGGLDTTAETTRSYAETGNLEDALRSGLQTGLISGVTQGGLNMAGFGAGAGARRTVGAVSNVPDGASEVLQKATEYLSRKPEAPQFQVDPQLNLSERARKALEDSGVTAVRREDNPYGAAYDPNDRSILIGDQKFASDAHVFHELGHDMWANRLTPEERALFNSYSGGASKSAAGREGYSATDLSSEDFSDMVSKAIQGRLQEVSPQFRKLITKYTGVAEDAMRTIGIEPKAAAVGAEQRIQLAKQGVDPNSVDMSQNAVARATEASPEQVDAVRQQMELEAEQVANTPTALKAERPVMQDMGNNLPDGTATELAARAGQLERKRADEYAKSSISLKNKGKDFVNDQFLDDTKFAQELDKRTAKSRGIKARDLKRAESLDSAIQAYRSTSSVFEQGYKDLGISDFAKKLSNQETYDAYRVYRTFKTNAERAQKNLKQGETVDSAYARFTGGRSLAEDAAIADRLDAERPDIGQLFNEEVQINRDILYKKANDPNLLLSPEEADQLVEMYPNYTPQSRAESDDVLQFTRNGKVGSQQGANVQKLRDGSTTKPIEDPMMSLMENADRLVKKGLANRVSNILVKDHGAMLRPIVTEKQLIAKENAKISMAELGDIGKNIERQFKKDSKWSKDALQAINNAKDVDSAGKVTLKQGDRQVTVKIANMTDNQYNRLKTNLMRQENDYRALVTEMDTLRGMADDIKSAKAGIMDSGALDAFEKNAGKNVLRRVVNGREEIYEVADARLAQNLANLSGRQISAAAEVLGIPTRIVKFFTTGPGNIIGFAPIAVTRDVLSTALFSRAPIRATFDPRSWVDAFKVGAMKGELFEEMSRRGITGTMVEGSRNSKHLSSDAIRNQGVNRAKVYAKNPKQFFRDIENFEMATERFSRGRAASARYRQSLAKYQSDPTLSPEQVKDLAFWDAADSYREDMVNFGRSGKVTQEINQFAAYLNPAVQGGNLIRRRAAEAPGRFAVRAGLATSMIAGAYAYSHSSEEKKAIYDSISDQDKEQNLIFVTDGAKRNPDTGEVSGIVKIPLPPEFYPFSNANKGMFEGADANEYGQIGLSALSAITGLSVQSANQLIGQIMPTNIKPTVENVTNYSFYSGKPITADYVKEGAAGDRTKEVNNSTTGTGKAISKALGGAINPIEADNLVRGFLGGATKDILATSDTLLNKAGIISKEDTTSSDPLTRLRKRYTSAFGQSEGAKYYTQIEAIGSKVANPDDKRIFESLHAKDPMPGLLDTPEKAVILLNRPKVYEAEKKLNDWNKSQGKAGNPFFDLKEEQRKVVLSMQAARGLNPGDKAMLDVIEKKNPWLQEYYDKQSEFFDKISEEAKASKERKKLAGVTASDPVDVSKNVLGMSKPEYTDTISEKFRAASALTDAKTKADYYKNNPELTDYLAQTEEYNRAKRAYLGLPQLDRFPGSKKDKKLEEGYFAITDKGQRKAYLAANPALKDYWAAKTVWNANEDGARARYEGVGNKKDDGGELKYVKTFGNSGYGSKGGSGSSDKAKDPRAYRVSLSSGGQAPSVKVTTKGGSAIPKKYGARKSTVAKPKVSWKKSKV